MKGLLPLSSAIGFLIVAGWIVSRWAPWGAVAALVCIVVAVLLLIDHDREIATRAADKALDAVDTLGAAKRSTNAERPL